MAIFEITTFQLIVLAVVVFALSRTVLRLKDNELGTSEFIFWSLVWTVVIVIVFVPEITVFFANIVGIKRGIDLAIYFSIVLLFYLIFRIYVKIEKIEQDITKIVREIALKRKK